MAVEGVDSGLDADDVENAAEEYARHRAVIARGAEDGEFLHLFESVPRGSLHGGGELREGNLLRADYGVAVGGGAFGEAAAGYRFESAEEFNEEGGVGAVAVGLLHEMLEAECNPFLFMPWRADARQGRSTAARFTDSPRHG